MTITVATCVLLLTQLQIQKNEQKALVFRKLSEISSVYRIPPKKRLLFIKGCLNIHKFETSIIRDAYVKFLKAEIHHNGHVVEAREKHSVLYILNRFLFAIPNNTKRPYSGEILYFNCPNMNGTKDELWPWRFLKNGSMALDTILPLSLSLWPDAVIDFDKLARIYPRRAHRIRV